MGIYEKGIKKYVLISFNQYPPCVTIVKVQQHQPRVPPFSHSIKLIDFLHGFNFDLFFIDIGSCMRAEMKRFCW
jgi:hypothetical protein